MSVPNQTLWQVLSKSIGAALAYNDANTTYDSPSIIYESLLNTKVTNPTLWSQLYGSIIQSVTPPAILDDTRYLMDDAVVTMNG